MSSTRKYKTNSHGCPIYACWNLMMSRCYNEKNKNYNGYGKKGIGVSNKWHSFDNFYSDMESTYFKKATLDRVNNELGYSKSNCKWADRKTQAINRSSSFFILDPSDNKKYTITDLSKKYEISRNTLTSRIRLGHKNFYTLIQKSNGFGRSKEFKYDDHFSEESRVVID